jgi:HlyD family secretion protein
VLATQTAYVTLSVSQDDIADLELGMAVDLAFDAYDEELFTGTIDSISYSAARMGSTSVSYTVNILMDGHPENIYEGMTCDATFVTRQETDCLYLPFRAVTTAADGSETVKRKTAAGETEIVPVKTGFSDGKNVQILSGLEEGDVVLIESRVNS